MGTYTTYYNIYKPADYETGYMTAFNTGMDNISTNIYNNATTISSHTSTLSSHTSSISTLDTFKNTLSALNGVLSCDGSGNFSAATGIIKNCAMNRGSNSAQTISSTSYEDVTGSSVTYTPPSGSTKVFYMFWAHATPLGANPAICHMDLVKNGSSLASAKWEFILPSLYSSPIVLMYVIDAWTGSQIVKVRARALDPAYPVTLNSSYYTDGVQAYTPVYNHYIIFSI